MMLRRQQTVSQFSVICDEQQAFGVLVQPACREQPLPVSSSEQIHDRFISSIFCCRHHALWLVHHQILIFPEVQSLPVRCNLIFFRVYFIFRFLNDLVSCQDSALADHFPGLAPGASQDIA